MAEENDEYLEAANNGDTVEVADALGDQLYILAGSMMRHGMQDVIAKGVPRNSSEQHVQARRRRTAGAS